MTKLYELIVSCANGLQD